MPSSPPNILQLADEVSAQYDADIIVYFGPMSDRADEVISCCRTRKNHKNVLLFLSTFGGSIDEAYRIARCLQNSYDTRPTDSSTKGTFYLYVHQFCKSAGTILALGADVIIMSQYAELGPIDVQLKKEDSVGERTSGLVAMQAMQALHGQSKGLFKQHFEQLTFDQDLAFSTKTAAEIATNLTVGLLKPIYEQIDPIRIAEMERYLKIASEYGDRLKTENVKDGSLTQLLVGYPSHGFIIDRREAETLFQNIKKPDDKLEALAECLEPLIIGANSKEKTLFLFFNGTQQDEKKGDNNDDNSTETSEGEGSDSEGESTKKIHPIDGKVGKDTATRPTGTD